MKKLVASAVGVALAFSALVVASPAHAEAQSFVNPEATASVTDLDIGSVDVDHSPTSLRMTANVQNLTDAVYDITFFVTPTAVAVQDGGAEFYLIEVALDPNAPTKYYLTRFPAGSPPQPLVSTGMTYSRVGNAHTIELPRTLIPFAGPVYVVGRVGNENGTHYAGVRPTGKLVGFGPIFPTARKTSLSLALSSAAQTVGGAPLTATATLNDPTAPGVIVFTDGAATLGAVSVAGGSASLAIPATLAAGAHAITGSYVPGDASAWAPATSAAVPLTVTGKATSVKSKLSKSVQHKGKRAAKVTITASTAGEVYLYDGKKRLKALALKKGKATYTLSKKLARGKHKLHVLFVPSRSAVWARSTSSTRTLTVKK